MSIIKKNNKSVPSEKSPEAHERKTVIFTDPKKPKTD